MTARRLFIGAVIALLALAPFVLPRHLVTPLTYIGLSVLVGIGLVVLTGVARTTSFGQAAFCGLAAYTTALLTTQFGWPAVAALPVSLLVTAAVALLLGLLTVRLAGHYLVLGTLVWAIGLFYLFGNAPGLGGFNGISGLPPISLFGVSITTPFHFYCVIWILVAASFVAASNLLDSRTGRAIRSLPTDVMAESFWRRHGPSADTGVRVRGVACWVERLAARALHPHRQSEPVQRQCLSGLPVHGGDRRRWPAWWRPDRTPRVRGGPHLAPRSVTGPVRTGRWI